MSPIPNPLSKVQTSKKAKHSSPSNITIIINH
jgi:hypothetical protein